MPNSLSTLDADPHHWLPVIFTVVLAFLFGRFLLLFLFHGLVLLAVFFVVHSLLRRPPVLHPRLERLDLEAAVAPGGIAWGAWNKFTRRINRKNLFYRK